MPRKPDVPFSVVKGPPFTFLLVPPGSIRAARAETVLDAETVRRFTPRAARMVQTRIHARLGNFYARVPLQDTETTVRLRALAAAPRSEIHAVVLTSGPFGQTIAQRRWPDARAIEDDIRHHGIPVAWRVTVAGDIITAVPVPHALPYGGVPLRIRQEDLDRTLQRSRLHASIRIGPLGEPVMPFFSPEEAMILADMAVPEMRHDGSRIIPRYGCRDEVRACRVALHARMERMLFPLGPDMARTAASSAGRMSS